MNRRINLQAGQKFGLLTVIREVEKYVQPSGQKHRAILCQCECGRIHKVRLTHLIHGRIISCGCVSGVNQTDLCGTRLHNVWRGMWGRTRQNKRNTTYRRKGIKVCDEWIRFKVFAEWALKNGYADNLQIDRIDNDGNYEPSNCRFVTPAENMNNVDYNFIVEYNGFRKPIKSVLREINKLNHFNAIYSRIKRGWNAKDAIDTPIRIGNYRRKVL